ncbi:hypothetical protein LCGC14_0753330 [marine sediment metagenome]|uniref:Phosphopantetheine adenylyltransferase n=1 Tax=marine sediment metagenome TaxID=412755 RepID=A0A0F9SNG3_9ZZZZ|nr:pantetheine-phosphate adenylyltransferase [Actinomycetota bacterium]
MLKAVCPGTFDPITNGHVDVINRAAELYDEVFVGVTTKSDKNLLFDAEERIKMVEEAVGDNPKIQVKSFDSLVVKFARENGANIIIRGLRAVSDFEHEFQMAQLNKKLADEVETMFVMANARFAYLSSSAVKEIAQFSGDVSSLVPQSVELKLKSRYARAQ